MPVGEALWLNADDPRQAVDLMRKFSHMTGMPVGGSMEKVLQRMEAAEGPQKIGADIRGLQVGEDTFQFAVKKTVSLAINRS